MATTVLIDSEVSIIRWKTVIRSLRISGIKLVAWANASTSLRSTKLNGNMTVLLAILQFTAERDGNPVLNVNFA